MGEGSTLIYRPMSYPLKLLKSKYIFIIYIKKRTFGLITVYINMLGVEQVYFFNRASDPTNFICLNIIQTRQD